MTPSLLIITFNEMKFFREVSLKRFPAGKLAALLLAFFTLSASIIVNRTTFERLPHLEDEFGYLFQAKVFAGGHAYIERHEDSKLFWQPFVLQPDNPSDGIQKRFGKYTPGWPLLLAFGVLVGWPVIVNSFLGMLSVLLIYRLGKEIFGETVGLVGATLMAISPMALLLNASLMSHTSSTFLALVFTYGYWRTTKQGKGRFRWAALAGLALGWMVASRPLTAMAIAAPIILHALGRLLDSMNGAMWRKKFVTVLMPLLMLSVSVIPTVAPWPIMNYLWTGDVKTNTYTLLWSYDKPGFGEGYGLNKGGHTLEYGLRNFRNDLKVYMRDLFGITITADAERYLSMNLVYGGGVGLSWVLILLGLIAGRRHEWTWVFFLTFVALVMAQMTYWIGSTVRGGAAYSLRYWYEATYAMCIVGAIGVVSFANWIRKYDPLAKFYKAPAWNPSAGKDQPIAISYLNGVEKPADVVVLSRATTFAQWLKAMWRTLWPGYILFIVMCAFSLIGYTPERFVEPLPPDWPTGLYRYNQIGQQQVDAIKAARVQYGNPEKPDQHVLIVVLHDPDVNKKDDWRTYGAAMALTSAYLDSDIVVARAFSAKDAEQVVRRFPDRLVLYQIGENLYPTVEAANAGAAAPSDKGNVSGRP